MLDFTKQLSPDEPLIHPSCVVNNCQFGQYVELGNDCIAADSYVGSYTYLFGENDIYNCRLGKFNSIATGVRINPVQHPMRERAPRCSPPLSAARCTTKRTTSFAGATTAVTRSSI